MDPRLVDAQKLLDEEQYDSAMALLTVIDERTPDYYSTMGLACWKMQKPEEALVHYRASVAANPLLEAASSELFQALYMVGSRSEAFAEWRRFVKAGGQPNNYNQLLREIEDDEYMERLVERFGPQVLEHFK